MTLRKRITTTELPATYMELSHKGCVGKNMYSKFQSAFILLLYLIKSNIIVVCSDSDCELFVRFTK